MYWKVNQRNLAGQLESETYGVGTGAVTDTRTYDALSSLLLTIRSDGPGGQLDGLEYDYDANRNVKLRKDTVGARAKTQNYTYDTLNRLATWQFVDATETVTGTFAYNTMGNLTGETYAGRTGINVTYQYGQNGAPRHALTTRNGGAYTYDAGGRQKTAPGRSVTYNEFDLPKVVTRNGQATTFAYDADRARVLKRNAAGQTTITLGGLFERRIASDVKNLHYIVAEGRAVAQLTRTQATPTGPVVGVSEIRYLHSDGQGSVTQTTNASGAVVDELFYDAFGRPTDRNFVPLTAQSRPIRRGYTGHEHDDELEVINMRGRIYDPLARSFLSADPFSDALSSQRLNRYSYVQNNPATLIDPTGFEPEGGPGEDVQPFCLRFLWWGCDDGGGGGGGGGDGGGDNNGGGESTDDSGTHVGSSTSNTSQRVGLQIADPARAICQDAHLHDSLRPIKSHPLRARCPRNHEHRRDATPDDR